MWITYAYNNFPLLIFVNNRSFTYFLSRINGARGDRERTLQFLFQKFVGYFLCSEYLLCTDSAQKCKTLFFIYWTREDDFNITCKCWFFYLTVNQSVSLCVIIWVEAMHFIRLAVSSSNAFAFWKVFFCFDYLVWMKCFLKKYYDELRLLYLL